MYFMQTDQTRRTAGSDPPGPPYAAPQSGGATTAGYAMVGSLTCCAAAHKRVDASPHFSNRSRSASGPGGPSRQEKAEERSNATVEAFDAAGGPPGRDAQYLEVGGGAVAPTGGVTPLARWICIARRGVPAVSAGRRRVDRGQCEKCALTYLKVH